MSATKQYVDLNGITVYDEEIKDYIEENTPNMVSLTQAEYDALTPAQKMDENTYYLITDSTPVGSSNLSDLCDVNISTPTDGQALVYSSVGRWTNRTLPPVTSVEMTNGSEIRFGVDGDGNYGYYKAGADTVTPFLTGGGGSLNVVSHNNIRVNAYTAKIDISSWSAGKPYMFTMQIAAGWDDTANAILNVTFKENDIDPNSYDFVCGVKVSDNGTGASVPLSNTTFDSCTFDTSTNKITITIKFQRAQFFTASNNMIFAFYIV